MHHDSYTIGKSVTKEELMNLISYLYDNEIDFSISRGDKYNSDVITISWFDEMTLTDFNEYLLREELDITPEF